tara:strand:+ start:13 stop:2904 length:2892 start_codon:yes stop_codon:yes gene_type:complete
MKIIQGQDKVILRAVSPDGGTTSGDLLTAFAEDGGTTGIRISNLEVETQTTLNSTTTTIEDSFLEVNRNNSTADGEDSGLFFNRGSENHALLYWDASDDNFVIGTTTHEATVTSVSNITLGQIKVATTPSNANHAASKSYVDSRTITIAGDDSAAITIDFDDAELVFTGGTSITTDTTAGGNSVKISVDAAMTGINSIASASGENITLNATTNLVVIDDFLTFANNQSDPSAAAVSKFYAKAPGTGGTGLFVINSAVDGGVASELLGATSADLTIFGDDSTSMTVNIPTQEFHVKGGNGITTSTSFSDSTQTLTIAMDSELLTVNSISSADSTSVLFNDGITLAGPIKADDSATINIDDALDVEGVITSGAITSSGAITATGFAIGSAIINEAELETIDGVTAGTVASEKVVIVDTDKDIGTFRNVTATKFIIGSADIDETDLEKIDGITNGAGAANKALVLDGSANIASGLAAVTASGVITAAGFTIGSAVINETDLEKIDGITNGAGAANKALVLDGSSNVASGLAALTASGVVTAAGFTIGSAVIDETDLEKLDGITNGTVAANKAVVVDANLDAGDFRNVTLSGTLHTTILDVREINSTDSTAVVINEALEVAGALTSGAITSSGVVTGTGFTIGSAVINETDLEKIDGITNGVGAANKALVLDGSANVASGLAALTASGVVTAAGFTIGSAVIDETDLEKLDGITNGAGAANKALVLDGSANVASGLAAVTASGVVTAAGFTIGSASIVEVDLEQIEDITAGTVIASKALVADANIDITGGRNITISGELDAATLDISGATTIDGLTTLAGSFKQAVHTFVATDAITEAEHAGRILLLGEVGGNALVTLTLPDATGSGNVYEFFVTVQNTSNYVIKVPDADNTISGQIMYLDEDGTAVSSFPTVSASDTITINGGTTGGLIGDTIKLVDIAADKFAVQGQMRVAAGADPSTPFSATVS